MNAEWLDDSSSSSCRFAGKYRDPLGSRRDGVSNGEPGCSESEADSVSRRLSFMKMVGLGKAKREAATERQPQAGEEPAQCEEAVEEVKPREPLSGEECVCNVVL